MFKPFEIGNESQAIQDLTLENDLDRISIYGNLQIYKDQEGLAKAKKLQALLNDVVNYLQTQADLPEKHNPPDAEEVENPFY